MLSFLFGAWRTITPRQIAWTVTLGVLGSWLFIAVSVSFGIFWNFLPRMTWWKFLRSTARDQVFAQTIAFSFLLCIVAADHAVHRGAPRVRTYVVAVLVASGVAAAFDWSYRYYVMGWFDFAKDYWKPVHVLSHFMWYLVIGGFITFVYADLRRARESAARLHAAVMERTRAARNVLQTRLQAMQARVEPQFLFDTLARIKEIYEHDASKGQRTLDDLIAYLRTAMPQMHESASTLAREIDLVRTYVAIVAGCSDNRVRLTIDETDDWSRTPFPPMLLLPLVEHAVACSRLARPEDGSIALRVVRTGAKLQVAIGHGGNAFSGYNENEAVTRVRERHLQTLLDGDAKLDLRTRADRSTEVVMEIPA